MLAVDAPVELGVGEARRVGVERVDGFAAVQLVLGRRPPVRALDLERVVALPCERADWRISGLGTSARRRLCWIRLGDKTRPSVIAQDGGEPGRPALAGCGRRAMRPLADRIHRGALAALDVSGAL